MPTTERAIVATPFAAPGGRLIASPFQFVADADTFMRVTSVCSVTGVVVALQGRRIDGNGTLQSIVETHTPNTDRTTKRQDYVIGVGAILNLTVFASAGAPRIGQCYIMVQLLRNFGGTAIVLGTLLGGYVTAAQALGFPGSPIVSSTEGEPVVREIVGTTPAAGVDVSETVPTGARWQLLTAKATFFASATVATRRIAIGFLSTTLTQFFRCSAPQDANAGDIVSVWFAQGTPMTALVGSSNLAGLPSGPALLAGASWDTQTDLLQAGDQFAGVIYTVREWLEAA